MPEKLPKPFFGKFPFFSPKQHDMNHFETGIK